MWVFSSALWLPRQGPERLHVGAPSESYEEGAEAVKAGWCPNLIRWGLDKSPTASKKVDHRFLGEYYVAGSDSFAPERDDLRPLEVQERRIS